MQNMMFLPETYFNIFGAMDHSRRFQQTFHPSQMTWVIYQALQKQILYGLPQVQTIILKRQVMPDICKALQKQILYGLPQVQTIILKRQVMPDIYKASQKQILYGLPQVQTIILKRQVMPDIYKRSAA